jgi:hypothetical protein
MSDKILFLLAIDDLQVVAMDTINRKLTLDEIETIKKKIAERIEWFDAISGVISENFV